MMFKPLGLRKQPLLSRAAAGALAVALMAPAIAHADEWPVYGRDAGGSRYSPLTQIVRSNVTRLKVARTVPTRDNDDGKDQVAPRSGFQTTPLLIDGRH